MKRKRFSAVVCGLLIAGFLLGACAPAVATPGREAVVGNPTYEDPLTPADGSNISERRPSISWTVQPNGQEIASFRMHLDGQAVKPVRTVRGSAVVFAYKPERELLPGIHTASVTITFDGYQPLTLTSRFTIVSNPVKPFAGKDSTQLQLMEAEAVSHLNSIRKTLAISDLSTNPSLTAAAQSHSNFLQINHLVGHYQNERYPGFTGITPQDRAAFFGYSGVATEGIDYGISSPRMSIEGLIDAPYHRLGLINPNDREVGAGFSLQSYNMVINAGNSDDRNDDRAMRYPYAGQTDAKSSWFVAESPNPLASYHKDRMYVGYPVSLSFHDTKTRELRLLAASFKDSAGNDISHYVVDSSRESESKKYIFLIPQLPLKSGETYQIKIEAQRILTDGSIKPIYEAWSFTTRATVAIDYLGLVNLEGVENLQLKLRNGDIEDVSYLLIRDGEIVRKYNAEQGFSWTNAGPLSPGRYRLQLASPSLSPDLIEYTVEIQESSGKRRSVTVVDQANLGPIPAVRAGLMRLAGRDHIELFWQSGKPAGVSYVLKRGGEVWRSYSADRYYSQRGPSLPDGDYLLEISKSGAPELSQYILSLYTDNGERRVLLTPVK
ncbi:hypothetical protein AXX12_05685 [Anaerosporomusa subterranea]|uniref:SCP domain-containing protein n=1 Tax=Anaerosporomusa subterranea TaxID=1794912 RepID=A0A154BPI3_ANASB|nr:CAP domain-containing protein [Anaerosporomusa subterranea]KYZ75933.1 hypothetical protein AXX12_05685 [Anaerosporomusa subterranea]